MTRRQLQVLNYIRGYVAEHGIPPSIREMTVGCGLKSTSQVCAALKGLEERGRIRRLFGRNRAIEIVADDRERVAVLERQIVDLRYQLAQYQQGVAA